MISRVSLLLLVIGLFAGVWSADNSDGRSAAQMQLVRRGLPPRAIGRAAGSSRNRLQGVSLPGCMKAAPIPRPRGIASGTYLVVNQAGVTQRLTITAQYDESGNHATVEQYTDQNPDQCDDQYTVRRGKARWHFIRLEEQTLARPMPAVTAADLR